MLVAGCGSRCWRQKDGEAILKRGVGDGWCPGFRDESSDARARRR